MAMQNGQRRNLGKYVTTDLSVMGRKSCLYTILEYSVQGRLSAHTDWISCYIFASIPSLYVHCPTEMKFAKPKGLYLHSTTTAEVVPL